MSKLVAPHKESFTPVMASEAQGTEALAKVKTLPTMLIRKSSFYKAFDQ